MQAWPIVRVGGHAMAWILALAAMVGPAPADPGWSRAQALARLEAQDVGERRQAVARLAGVGEEADTEALVKRLHDEDPVVRAVAEGAVWRIWGRSGDAELDRRLEHGTGQMQAGELIAAIATFSAIIEARPQFTEAWNKRATALFLAGELDRSLRDCDEVLKRNRWHFGALAGYGQILYQKEQYAKALEYWRRALAVNPGLEGIRTNIEGLELQLERDRERQRRQQARARSALTG